MSNIRGIELNIYPEEIVKDKAIQNEVLNKLSFEPCFREKKPIIKIGFLLDNFELNGKEFNLLTEIEKDFEMLRRKFK